MRLVYFAYGDVSVFDSQVIALLNYYSKNKIINEIHLAIGVKRKFEKEKYRDKICSNINLHFYWEFPHYSLIDKLTEISLTNIIKKVSKNGDVVFHARDEVLGHLVYNSMLKCDVDTSCLVIDIRGAGLEQLIEYGKLHKFLLYFKKKHRKNVYRTISKTEVITVVSSALKNYVQSKIKNPKKNIKVIHCLASNIFGVDSRLREEVRQNLSLESKDKLIVFLSGGNSNWQNTNQIVTQLSKKNISILNLSISLVKNSNVINLKVPYCEVPKYLNSADIAIIWRDKTITNKVASPVKFSEYLCCGLPVISNDSVDLISNVITKYNCGRLIKDLKDVDNKLISDLLKIDRSRISKIGKSKFGIDAIAGQYLGIYKNILNS